MAHEHDPIFIKNGVPVKFCFHKSVAQGRAKITQDVERHGGVFVMNEKNANVLLVDEQQDVEFLRRRYYSSTELYRLSLYVEPRGFVQTCIRAGEYRHAAPIPRGMPGRAPAAPGAPKIRIPFTEEDRDHLAYYLATLFPSRDGRMGNKAYKDLVDLGQTDDPSWAWARRHTFHSWREHYKIYTDVMDNRINFYLRRLKDVGHHFGQDPRRHDFRCLRQEAEESDEEGQDQQEEQEEQRRVVQRRDPGGHRQRQALPAAAERRQKDQDARDYLAQHERDLLRLDEEEADSGPEIEEVPAPEPQRVKRHRAPPDVHPQGEAQGKRARVSGASSNEAGGSGIESDADEGTSGLREGDRHDESQEIEGNDLFGDREYYHDDMQDMEYPRPFSPRASPIPEQGPPLSTQATLITTPRTVGKEAASSPSHHTPTKTPRSEISPATSPSTQVTMVVTQERIVRPAYVRGVSAEPSPSKETRARGAAAAMDAPYRNTRARSRSVEPQPSELSLRGDSGKRKEALPLIDEDALPEEQDDGIQSRSGMSGFSAREDEVAVVGLLDPTVESETPGEEENTDEDREDGGEMWSLPSFHVIEIDDPSDSDDAETHESLTRGAAGEGKGGEGSEGEGDDDAAEGSEQGSNSEEQHEDDYDADRIRRMATGSLLAGPAPVLEPRVTRSMTTATQSQTLHPQMSPRRTRSRTQRAAPSPARFPSPGTKARAVVNRFQEGDRETPPYMPPPGTRAARVVRGKGRRG